jgi:hypothetical protein
MAIHVTPIPRLTTLAAPAFTLGTSNVAGDALTAVASNSTLLAFDATTPAAVAATAATGSATVSARRDHVHVGTGATGTVTDNAIVLFDGTGGASLQQSSSNTPTFSDAGILTIPAGQIVFPATESASGGANTLDDYQEGTFTPTILDGSFDPGESQAYSTQVGRYTKIGNQCIFTIMIETTSLGSLTLTDGVRIGGLPFTAINSASVRPSVVCGNGQNFTIPEGTTVTGFVNENTTLITLRLWDSATGISNFLLSEWSADGLANFSGVYEV